MGRTCAFPVSRNQNAVKMEKLANASMLTMTTTLRNIVNNNVTIGMLTLAFSPTEQMA